MIHNLYCDYWPRAQRNLATPLICRIERSYNQKVPNLNTIYTLCDVLLMRTVRGFRIELRLV